MNYYMTYRELLKQLENVDDSRLDEKVEIQVVNDYYTERVYAWEVIHTEGDSEEDNSLYLMGGA